MEKKTAAKLDETKAAVKTAGVKAAAKADEAKEAVKTAVAEKKEAGTAALKSAVKDVADEAKKAVDETKAAGEKAKEAVKETVKEKAPVKAVRKTVKKEKAPVKTDLKPEIFIQFDGKEAVLEEAVEKAKSQFVAEGHRVSSIKSLQVYLKPEEHAAYYVINQKFAGRVDLF